MARRFRRRSRFRRRRRRFGRRRRMRRRRVVLDPEWKNLDVGPVTFPVPNTIGIFTQLTDIDQGITALTRIGRQVVITNVSATMQFTGGPTLVNGMYIKMWLVRDSVPAGVQFGLADLLTGMPPDVFSFRNLSLTRRLKVLWTKTIRFDAALPSRIVRMNRRLKNPVRYQGTGTGIADVETGALAFVFLSNQGVAAELPMLTLATRVRFVG